jgi:hypothetical protein
VPKMQPPTRFRLQGLVPVAKGENMRSCTCSIPRDFCTQQAKEEQLQRTPHFISRRPGLLWIVEITIDDQAYSVSNCSLILVGSPAGVGRVVAPQQKR